MTNLEALYLTLFIVGFWVIFGWLSLKIRKFLGEKLSNVDIAGFILATIGVYIATRK